MALGEPIICTCFFDRHRCRVHPYYPYQQHPVTSYAVSFPRPTANPERLQLKATLPVEALRAEDV